jgi:hypothetical protein
LKWGNIKKSREENVHKKKKQALDEAFEQVENISASFFIY